MCVLINVCWMPVFSYVDIWEQLQQMIVDFVLKALRPPASAHFPRRWSSESIFSIPGGGTKHGVCTLQLSKWTVCGSTNKIEHFQ